jgi:type I restriction-modification system DNA methylase subunit
MNQHTKDFVKILENIKPSKHRYEVFSDWLVLAAATLYSWKRDTTVEEEYAQTAKNYTPEELEKHARLLEIAADALEEKEQDFLGEVFTLAELTNSKNGQFFTQYYVSRMMAEITMGETELPKDRVCKISDPCCGAGGMLIAGAMVMKQRGFNYQRDALFIGQDIDARCARMTYIQLSLLGVPAVIICGNTLAMMCYWQRETIGYHMADMDSRLRIEKMIDIIKNPEQIQKSEPVEIKLPRGKLAQGELF